MRQKKVAVILTGELRYIDYCYNWWKSLVKNSDYEVNFYSSTWNRISDSVAIEVAFTNKIKKSLQSNSSIPNSISKVLPDIKTIVINDNFLNNWIYPHELIKHGSYSYYFGRTAMLYNATNTFHNELCNHDVIVHSRWDTAFRNTNNFDHLVKQCIDNISFRSLSIDKGNVWACDWAYGGPATEMLEIYTDSKIIDNHISIFNDLYKKDPTCAYTFLIGHNMYSSYITRLLKTIVAIDFDTTLIRKHNLKFDFTEDSWQKLNKLFLNTPSIPPVLT